tara:strand:- start:55 stop:924 length:870 start_codon:yes stop_codon:yes gene_type:complete
MSTLTSKLTLTGSSADYGAALSLAKSTTLTHTHTSGISRDALGAFAQTGLTSGKVCQIAINDGDEVVAQAGTHEGQFIDITDNHGLKKRYVFVDGAATSVATGAILVAGSDIGVGTLTVVKRLDLVDGIAVDVTDGLTQNAILALLATAINHANGHNGSIVATTPATAATGVQTTTLTNRDSLAPPTVDNVSSTFSILNALTNSQADHVRVIKKGEYTAPVVFYISNNHTYHATNNRIFLYFNDSDGTTFLEIRGGQFAYVPVDPQHDLFAYASSTGTVIDHAAFGTQA